MLSPTTVCTLSITSFNFNKWMILQKELDNVSYYSVAVDQNLWRLVVMPTSILALATYIDGGLVPSNYIKFISRLHFVFVAC